MEAEDWGEARRLAAQHPELNQAVCLPWADWLLSRGSFQEARLAYRWQIILCLSNVMIMANICYHTAQVTVNELYSAQCWQTFSSRFPGIRYAAYFAQATENLSLLVK